MNIFKKETHLTITQYFEIIHPKYTVLRITPNTSIRNYNSENIAKSMVQMYKSVYRRIEKENKKLYYNAPVKVCFMIDIVKRNVNFYFICPQQYSRLLKEKCYETWCKITIQEVNNLPELSPEAVKYQVRYQKEDALSISIDKRLNQPLRNILNVVDIMEDTDRISILYNFIPCTQKSWLREYEETIKKYNENLPIDKNHGTAYIIKVGILGLFSIISQVFEVILEAISNSSKKDNEAWQESVMTNLQNVLINNRVKLSYETNQKRNMNVINTQIVIVSDSIDKTRKLNNALSVCDSFKTLDGDNKLIAEKLSNKNTINYTDYKIKNVLLNKMSTVECKNLLELPGRDILLEHENIEKVDTLENPVPEELQKGIVFLGEVTYRGKKYFAYLPSNYDKANLPLVLLSAQGGGKTTLLCNIAMDCIKAGESVFVIDYIKNCELANAIKAITPKDKLAEIDCTDINHLQGFGFNEIKLEGNTDMEKLDMANLQAQQVIALINAINVDDESRGLTSQMKRYLRSAANVVFFCGKQNVGDVIECLEDFTIRQNYVNIVNQSEDAKNILRRELVALEELNDRDKTGVIIGTKGNIAIKGILDRIDDLQQDMRTKIMFNKDCRDNVDFVDCMNKGKVVLIKIPEHIFFSVSIKDMLTTFFCTKYILAIKLRSTQGKPKRCNMIIDEISQCEGAENWIKQTLSQTRKFGGKYIFALHYLNQLKFGLDEELKGAGASFILLQGSDKQSYNTFEQELKPYELEDLLRLKQYHAINLLKTNDGWTKFITKLPPEPVALKKQREINNL